MREIHFFTNLNDVEQVSDWDLETMHTDFVDTQKAIFESDEKIVKTTQLTFLSSTWFYIDKGYKVFIHNDSQVIEVKEHMKTRNDKDIRRGHNIEKCLIAGVFGQLK